MSLTTVWASVACLTVLMVALGVHRWRGVGERELIRARIGLTDPPRTRFAAADRLLARVPGVRRFGSRLKEAGLPLGTTDVLLLHVPVVYLTTRVGEGLWGPTLGRPLAVVGPLFATWSLVDMLARRRRERVLAQVPDLIRLLAAGARAGLSMSGAFTQAADDIGEPTSSELRRVVVSLELGKPLTVALEEFADRLRAPDLDVVTSAIAIQQRSGGDLVRLLTRLGTGLEALQRSRRDARSVSAGLGAQAYLALVLGLGTAAVMNAMTQGGLERAMHKPLTAAIITVAAVFLAVAGPALRRVTLVTA